jgi:hypothetical protein
MAFSSMLVSASHTGRSTDVKMQLLLGEISLPVGQLGPDFLLLKEPFLHPPTEGTMVVQVDESEHRWQVILPEGISSESRRVVIAKVA